MGRTVRKPGPVADAAPTCRCMVGALLCRDDGLNWAAVFNSDGNRAGKGYAVEIDGLLHQTAHQIKDWPAADLYKNYSI